MPKWEVYASWSTDFLVFSTHSTISVNFKAKRKDATLTKAWTKAIDRKNKDGSNWMPSKNHFICGKHFFSGRPSTNSRQGVFEAWKTSLFDIITFCFFDHFFTNSSDSFPKLRICEKHLMNSLFQCKQTVWSFDKSNNVFWKIKPKMNNLGDIWNYMGF